MINLKSVTKEIGPDIVLDDVSLRFERGELYCLRGINGSGKTMLLRVVAGLILPTRGEVWVDGAAIGKQIEFPSSMGILIERPSLIGRASGLSNLRLLASLKEIATEEDLVNAIKRVGLDPGDKRPTRKYSLGMKQRLGIAMALMEKPDLILLDEPFNGLDDAGVALIMDVLNQEVARGVCVIVASHGVEQFEKQCDQVIVLNHGKVVDILDQHQTSVRVA